MPLHVFAKALGSAIYGAVAAGIYPDAAEAARHMGSGCCAVYQPMAENTAVYEKLYAEYKTLHDYFGRGASDVMKRLKAIRGN